MRAISGFVRRIRYLETPVFSAGTEDRDGKGTASGWSSGLSVYE